MNENIHFIEKKVATKNLALGKTVYGERLLQFEGEEYREWDPYRSKLAAAIRKGLKQIPIQPKMHVLYLGAASGTTASHVSDIVGQEGIVYCVEFSPRATRDLLRVCESRSNMIPILADARFPEKYRMFIGPVDVIYQDIAQPAQAIILVDNAKVFLKNKGFAILAIKARSIDSSKEISKIFSEEIDILKENGFVVEENIESLKPFDKDHCMVIGQLI
ncbi:MAG: fibrillarin-like rRNA/tRNA 2'-O-methyltransferase [Candidatus Sifarchaeia archaeon]|jgi:fibrillarin-like pre-rRNA processing protein